MCKLVEELQKLKKSSNESIDNEQNFSDFKKYMHVKRQVEKDLESIINLTKSCPKALVLVCGNVGDGKSHLLSYLKNEKNVLNEFYIHNDATESYSRNQTEKQALSQVLTAFNDENIESEDEEKIIVAINLGVLSNFIYSYEGKGFSKLRHYVETCRVLVDDDSSEAVDNCGVFFHVNFGDYHLYRLNEGTVDSPYIKDLFCKIFAPNFENPFYMAYHAGCNNCKYSKNCPVKTNYEMMQSTLVQDGIIRILIETIVKEKLIISTRELLNFIFDIIVHPSFSASKYKGHFQLDYLLPNLLYEHPENSDILSFVTKYDLLNTRREDIDEIILTYVNSHNQINIFEKYVAKNKILTLIKNNFIKKNKRKNNPYLTALIRLIKISPETDKVKAVNEEYVQFIKYLYAYSKRDNKTIRELAHTVEECVYKSTGSEDKNKIVIREIGDQYSLSTKLEIKLERFRERQANQATVFDKFSERIKLTFYVDSNGNDTIEDLYIDYELYEMLVKIYRGYQISSKERNYYAAFFSFVEKLIAHSQYKTELIIKRINKNETYKLMDESYEDEEPSFYFEEVN